MYMSHFNEGDWWEGQAGHWDGAHRLQWKQWSASGRNHLRLSLKQVFTWVLLLKCRVQKMTVMSFSVYVKCNSARSYGKPRGAQPAGGGGGADEGSGRLQVVTALAGLLLQDISVSLTTGTPSLEWKLFGCLGLLFRCCAKKPWTCGNCQSFSFGSSSSSSRRDWTLCLSLACILRAWSLGILTLRH